MARPTQAMTLWAVLALASLSGAQEPNQAKILSKIVEVNGEIATIDRGLVHGVQPGMVFDVYRPARLVVVPITDDPLLQETVVTASIVVLSAKDATASCRIENFADTGSEVQKGRYAVLNRTRREADQSPLIEALTASAATAAWNEQLQLQATVVDPNGGPLVYRWSCTGGQLGSALTMTPRNTWKAPFAKDAVDITLVVRDATGLESAPKKVTVRPRGAPANFLPRVYDYQRHVGDHGAVFRRIADVAFGPEGDAFVLDPERRVVTQVDAAWRPLMVYGPYSSDFDFFRLEIQEVAGQTFAFLLDREARSAYRFTLAAATAFDNKAQVFGRGGSDGVNGELIKPVDLAINDDGEVYILDAATGAVQLFGPDGTFQLSVGSKADGKKPLNLEKPVAIAIDPTGRLVVLDDGPVKKVVVFRDHRPQFQLQVADAGETMVGVDFDPITGKLFVLSNTGGASGPRPVKVLDCAPGARVTQFGSLSESNRAFPNLRTPARIKVSPMGEVYAISWADGTNGRELFRYRNQAGSWQLYGKWGGESATFESATRISADLEGYVGVLAPGVPAAMVLAPDGWIVAKFGHVEGILSTPKDLGSDAAGNFYVLDAGLGNVRKHARDGTLAGQIGIKGSGATGISDHLDVYASDNGEVFVLMYRNELPVFHFDARGQATPPFPAARDLDINYPVSIAAFLGGDAIVGCNGPVHIKRYARSGDRFAPENLYTPYAGLGNFGDLGVLVNGFVVFCDPGEAKVGVLDARLGPLGLLSDNMAKHCPEPVDIGTDGYGGIYVLDADSHRIAVFSLFPRSR